MSFFLLGLAFCQILIWAKSFLIRMHWRRPATDGAGLWISCKQPAFLSSFSHLQVIQNKRPLCSVAAYVTWIKNFQPPRKVKSSKISWFFVCTFHLVSFAPWVCLLRGRPIFPFVFCRFPSQSENLPFANSWQNKGRLGKRQTFWQCQNDFDASILF